MNWFEFIFASFIFLLFLIFILVLYTDRYSNYIEELKFSELRKTFETFSKILFDYGTPENWDEENKTPISFGLSKKIYFRPLIVYGENNRSYDIINLYINFDFNCKKYIYDKSIRIFDEKYNEINYTFIEKNYCDNGGLKNSTIVFFDKFNETKKYYIYYSSDKILEKNYTLNTSLVGYWDFEDSNDIAKDKTHNQNNGKIFNKITTDGKYGNAINFTDNTFVNVSNNKNLNNTQISIELWIKISDFVESKIIEKYNSYGIVLENNKIKAYVEGLPEEYKPKSTNLEIDKWYHIVFSSNGYFHKIYIDGLLNNQTTYQLQIPTLESPLSIGADFENNYNFHGIIDEVRIYSSVLSEEDVIAANYSKPIKFILNPEMEDEVISISKIETAKKIDLDEIDKVLGNNYKFYVEVYK